MNEIVQKPQGDMFLFPAGTSVEKVLEDLPHAKESTIHKNVALLMTAMKVGERDEVDGAMMAEIYRMVLEGFPEFAITAAIKVFILGKVENVSKTFVPSTAELVCEVRRQIWLKVKIEKEASPPATPVLPDSHFSKRYSDLKIHAAKDAAFPREPKSKPCQPPVRKKTIRRFDEIDSSNGDVLVKALGGKSQ